MTTPKTAGQKFVLTRTFAAPRSLVWKAWTEREGLMQWFGPKGFKNVVANLDLRPGGRFHYGLVSPDGKEVWGRFIYREIVPMDKIVWISSFSDKDGGLGRHPFSDLKLPLQMLSQATFTEQAGKTTVTLEISALDASPEEQQVFDSIRDSMTQGWTGTLDQLEAYLPKP